MEILNKASEEGKTVRQIRKEEKGAEAYRKKQTPASNNQKFQEWYWRPKGGRFDLTIRNYNTNLLRGREREQGIKTKMRVKLAAKMLIIAWTLMKKKEPFNPNYLNNK